MDTKAPASEPAKQDPVHALLNDTAMILAKQRDTLRSKADRKEVDALIVRINAVTKLS